MKKNYSSSHTFGCRIVDADTGEVLYDHSKVLPVSDGRKCGKKYLYDLIDCFCRGLDNNRNLVFTCISRELVNTQNLQFI